MRDLYTRNKISTGIDNIQQVALSGDRLAIVSDDNYIQVLHGLSDSKIDAVYSQRWKWRPVMISLSPSMRYLMLRSGDGRQIAIIDLLEERLHSEFGSPQARLQSMVATFTEKDREDFLLISRQRMLLECFGLENMSNVFTVDYERPQAFVFQHIVPLLGDEDTIPAIGYLFSEQKYSLYTFSYDDLIQGRIPDYPKQMAGQLEINDYAYRLAAGPSGTEQLVIFRDPEDDEEPDPDEANLPLGDVENFRGFYIRKLHDGGLVERIEIDLPVVNGSTIFATERAVVAACPKHIEIIPRSETAAPSASIKGIAFTLDSKYLSFAVANGSGMIDYYKLVQ